MSVKEGLSDHKLVLVSLKHLRPPKHEKRQTICARDFSKADDVSILDYLEASLDSFDVEDDVNTLWTKFKHNVNYCLQKFVPQKN